MARKGHSLYIKKITGKEAKLLTQLAKTGIATQEQAQKYCNIKPVRLRKMERSKYVKLTEKTVEGKQEIIVQLSKRGKQYIRDNFLYEGELAHAQIDHLEHDLKLTEKYYNLPEEHKKTFINEKDLIKEIYIEKPYLKGKLESCLDAAIVIDGQRIGIEIVGRSYTQKDIEAKIQIATDYLKCADVEWIK